MAFDWKKLVDMARSLARDAVAAPDPETYHRTAVNRCYFGAFGYARSYAIQYLKYSPKENPDDHGRLREHLRLKKRKGAADRLSQLRQWRNDADYLNDLPWVDVSITVALAIRQASEVFEHLSPPATSNGGQT